MYPFDIVPKEALMMLVTTGASQADEVASWWTQLGAIKKALVGAFALLSIGTGFGAAVMTYRGVPAEMKAMKIVNDSTQSMATQNQRSIDSLRADVARMGDQVATANRRQGDLITDLSSLSEDVDDVKCLLLAVIREQDHRSCLLGGNGE